MERPRLLKSKSELPSDVKIIDTLDSALEELFYIENPTIRKGSHESRQYCDEFVQERKGVGLYVLYPEDNVAVRTVPEDIYFTLRTARNRNIITTEEQKKYRNTTVGIAGLSVGSAIFSSLVLTSGPQNIKIADPDHVEITNLNRIRATLLDIGDNKAHIAAREAWRIDPYLNIEIWDKGFTEENMDDFFSGTPKLDFFIDEMDSLPMKFAARELAKKKGIPVLMATDNGDSVIVDVERFDQEPDRKIFHGLVEKFTEEEIASPKSGKWFEIAETVIGKDVMTQRHIDSLPEIGRTLAGIPQIGSDAVFAGVIMSVLIRKLANGENIQSGKYVFYADDVFKKSFR